ncbi:MAG: amidohydrolase [Deltaproteobacteria bacterium]|nr:amidohydrolase [Deltaproteobacteria bacterium]MBW1962613.1 amidohydrolase [Deltaproteobacteria bacterium]
MELILKNAHIITMDHANPRAEALALQFGRIYRVGSTAEVEKLAQPETKVIDLKGHTLLPGFIDTHNHFCLYAFLYDQVDCRAAAGCVRGEDIIEKIRQKASRVPPGQWIMGWGYAPYLLEDKKDLTRHDLNRATQDHPVCLVHVSVHGAVANSAALKKLGFTKQTPDPPGGKIHRDANGEPNGILSESAFMGPLFFNSPSVYAQMMAQYDDAGRTEMMIRCARIYHRLGLVGAHDPFVDPLTLETYQKAVDSGRFDFRIYAYILNQAADPLLATGIRRGFGSEWLRIGAIKIFLDGGMSSRTAAVFKPYEKNGGTGILNYDQDGIEAEIRKYDRAGYQISVHAQGNRAIHMLLEAFEKNIAAGNPHRHHIVHAGNITAAQIDRVEKLGVAIVSQANFLSLLGDGFIEAFGPVRSKSLYPFATLLKRNIKLTLSSDCPVADPNPLIGVRDAICRRTAGGQSLGPAEGITAEQALALYTREAAHVSFEEAERGTIQQGKRADVVVLDRDPLALPPEEIAGCKVTMTVVGGRIVYRENQG